MQTIRTTCHHRPILVDGVEVVACNTCGDVRWSMGGEPVDAAVGLARLFGHYDLIGAMPAVAAPAPRVLVYRAPNRRLRSRLRAFPAHTWHRVDDDLWMSHDGRLLNLAPTDPLLADNLAGSTA